MFNPNRLIDLLIAALPLETNEHTQWNSLKSAKETAFLERDPGASYQQAKVQRIANRLKQIFRFRLQSNGELRNRPHHVEGPRTIDDLGELSTEHKGTNLDILRTLSNEDYNILIQNQQDKTIAQILTPTGSSKKWMYIYFKPATQGHRNQFAVITIPDVEKVS